MFLGYFERNTLKRNLLTVAYNLTFNNLTINLQFNLHLPIISGTFILPLTTTRCPPT